MKIHNSIKAAIQATTDRLLNLSQDEFNFLYEETKEGEFTKIFLETGLLDNYETIEDLLGRNEVNIEHQKQTGMLSATNYFEIIISKDSDFPDSVITYDNILDSGNNYQYTNQQEHSINSRHETGCETCLAA